MELGRLKKIKEEEEKELERKKIEHEKKKVLVSQIEENYIIRLK